MKNFKIILIFHSLAFWVPNLFAGQGAVNNINANNIMNVAATGTTAAYTTTNAAQCGWRSPMPCVRAAMGVVQIAELLTQLRDSSRKQSEFGIGKLPTPEDYGLCLNPQATGCTPDPIDLQIADSPLGDALKTGDVDALLKATDEVEAELDQITADLASKGYTLNTENGTLTGPNGGEQSLASLANDPNNSLFPEDFSKQLSSKLSSIQDAANKKGNVDDNGSTVVGGPNIIAIEEFIDDPGVKKRGLASLGKNKKKDDAFLAAMADNAAAGAVGVAGDDIFKMIQRRYDKKKKTEEFIFR